MVTVALVAAACTSSSQAVAGQLVEAPEPIDLGIAAGRRPGQTPIDALAATEQVTQRRFDILRTYSFWDDDFPNLRQLTAAEEGRELHLSINPRRIDGSIVAWNDIATAVNGSDIERQLSAWIDRIAAFDGPLRVTFHHEPDIEPEFGTAAEFVAAWQRFATLLDEADPTIDTVWVVTAFTLDRPEAELFWPGEEFVDVIGADAFNWFGCRGNPEAWRSPAEVLAPLLTFAADHPELPLMLAELGSDEDPNDPTRKAAWFDELAALVTQPEYERLQSIVLFHNDHDDRSSCDWWLDSSEATAEALVRFAASDAFDLEAAPTPPCPIVATHFSRTDDLALVDGDGDGRFDFEFGLENRFLGIGEQSNDGADHRVVFAFDPLGDIPEGATIELRVRVGERQPALGSPVQVIALDAAVEGGDRFAADGRLIAPAWFDASTVGGHHLLDVTEAIDPATETTLRLQLAERPARGDGSAALFVGAGDAGRSVERPALVVRHCS